MDELYFCFVNTESDHFGLSQMLLDQCELHGCELRYYRELKDGHIPMWREVKLVGPKEKLNLVRRWLRENHVSDDFRKNPYKNQTGLSKDELAEVEWNIKSKGSEQLP